uniref:Autophagy-related protein 27 n=1 Tax=Mycena chlorophos TaxID=658473 RepID=A0ABQ0LYJ3_MYCCL|nr:predicted protein [Mycena chlorophos]
MFLFLFTHILTATAATIPSQEWTDVDSCRFTLGPKQYNLCPVLSGAAAVPLPVHAQRVSAQRASIPLGDDREWLSTDQGRSGTWHSASAGPSTPEMDEEGFPALAAVESGNSLIVGLSRTPRSPSLSVRLSCDPDVELELEKVSSEEEGSSWRTRHACPLPLASATQFADEPADDSDTTSESGDPPPADEPPNDDSEQLLDRNNGASRRSIAITFVIISIAVISIAVFTYKNPHFIADRVQPALHHATALIQQVPMHVPAALTLPRSLRRAGEGKLVRWAQEDLELDTEDDVMVNGGNSDQFELEAGDEYIPLRPSPRKGGRGSGRWIKNYGSAGPVW